MYEEREPLDSPPPAELAALESQLAGLAPMPAGVNRDRLMFEAGRASVERATSPAWTSSKFWPVAAVLSTAASLLLATLLWQRADTGQVAEGATATRDFVAQVITPNRTPLASGRWSDRMPSGYLGQRQVALTRGVAVLEYETPSLGGNETDDWSPPSTAFELRQELLPTAKQPRS